MQAYDPQFLSCIDYLTAAADYQEFINLMLDFKVIRDIQEIVTNCLSDSDICVQDMNEWHDEPPEEKEEKKEEGDKPGNEAK